MLLILSPEGWGWQANHSFVGWREYCGMGSSGTWSDPEGCAPSGTTGGVGLGGIAFETLVSVQIGLGWVALMEVGLGWLVPVPRCQIHCQTQTLGDYSTLSKLFLSQQMKFLQISHHGKFQSIGGLHLRTGISWILVHNQQRSFLNSSCWVYVSFSLKCAPKLDNQILVGVWLDARWEFCWCFIVSSFYRCDIVCVKLSLHSRYPKTVG